MSVPGSHEARGVSGRERDEQIRARDEAQSAVRSFIYSVWGHAGDGRVRPALAALDRLAALAEGSAAQEETNDG